MDVHKGNIYEILNGNRQFLIPVYQRYYSWDIEQCQRLWKDIMEMQKSGKSGHFVGSIVNIAEQAMPTGVQKYMIIDGQQRMTTLTLLLIALRNYAENHLDVTTINVKRIDNMLLKNECESGNDRYKLLLTETDREILIALIEKKPIQTSGMSKIITNFKYFEKQIELKELTPLEVYESIGKLQIVNITLERGMDNPQAIFESLNSTGKELSESDLIRNYVLMGLDNDEQSYVYEHLWRPMELLFHYEKQNSIMDRFFRDYLTMKTTRIPKINRVYDEFKVYHINCEFSAVRDLCQDLYTYAEYYTNMVFARSSSPKLKNLYEDMKNLKMEVVYPFLLKIHYDYSIDLLTEDDFLEIIKLCISYIFRRSICDIPPNSLNKTFATLRNEIKQEDYLKSIKAFFILRDDYKQFPNDDKFSAAFLSRDIYTMRIRNFILSHLENYNNKAPIIIENYTIEHIMPQNPNLSDGWKQALGDEWKDIQKTYLHTIGNLTLTAYNSELSDKTFIEKLEMEGGFKESALKLNSYLVKLTEWNESHIKERAKQLLNIALKIWKYPVLSEDELAPYKVEDKVQQEYSLEIYDFNAFTKMLYDAINKRIMNFSPDVKREFKKLYIAYKLETNFVDIVVRKQCLHIFVNMKYSEVYDPQGICKDVTNLGCWGNGDVEMFFEHMDEIDSIMSIVEQSYRLQEE